MPELPEVETTCRAISPFLHHKTIANITLRHTQLRLPISADLQLATGQTILAVNRRAKYLIIELTHGRLLIHLGMSGHLRILTTATLPGKHDHIDLTLTDGILLRYHDPRRFGLWLYTTTLPDEHPFFSHLGPEPLSNDFNGDYLYQKAHKKTQSIKSFIMTNETVVGVGNIYATESLFLAGIHPLYPAGLVSKDDMDCLATFIKQVLQQAIIAGGTTLRDFYTADGKPGYFANELQVYGRKHQACFRCQSPIEIVKIAGRSSTFCPQCQPFVGR